ncbi:MAG TPA: pilus assembly protein N-terminal domain-containing protein, partial [Roseiarcus sp.]|nr:pilus assembly protein N-terminal domain-containing protein [Roseiarcus sp.]
MNRALASGALALALALGLGSSAAKAAAILDVVLDQAKIARVPEGTKTLVIGSPIVADVTLLKGSNTMVVTG